MVGLELLRATKFGARVAEEEIDLLERYFVQTSQWRSIIDGDVDIVFGAKGAGKSALYSLLVKSGESLRKRGIIAVSAENLRGAPAFESLEEDPPSTERDFISMWKLYFVSLVAEAMHSDGVDNASLKRVLEELELAGVRRGDLTLKSILRNVMQYIRNLSKIDTIEGTGRLDTSGAPSVTGKIKLREPSTVEAKVNAISIDGLLELLDQALAETKLKAWLLLDRLDVAFNENEELEENALRALFRAYRDLADKPNISLKIFLRSDIWQRITEKGFREASHVTKSIDITWDKQGLVNLLVRRALANEAVCNHYGADAGQILESYPTQEAFFDKIFPAQIDLGERKPSTIDWMLSRVQDGTGKPAPRELIHLANASVDVQIRKFERGEIADEGDDYLLSRAAIKEGLEVVSKVRLEQTLYAEYSSVRTYVEQMREEKTGQTIESLAKIWGLDEPASIGIAQKLVQIGFFEARGTKQNPEYWVPFVYRSALSMVQGSAD